MNINKTHVILVNVSKVYKDVSLYHHSYSKYICPYIKTIIDFHGGKYRVILTPFSL